MSCPLSEHGRGYQRIPENVKLSVTERKADILKTIAGI